MKLPRTLQIPPLARDIPLNRDWGVYAKLSISREETGGGDEPVNIVAMFLFVPDEREELHYHIELTEEGVEELWVWLHEHMHATAQAKFNVATDTVINSILEENGITTKGNDNDTEV